MKLFAEMFTIAPGNKDHHVATRCAVGVFVPLIILVLIGRTDLAIFASFGAFTGIYGRGELHRKRLFIQVRAGSLMLLVILLATLSARADRRWACRTQQPRGPRWQPPPWWPGRVHW